MKGGLISEIFVQFIIETINYLNSKGKFNLIFVVDNCRSHVSKVTTNKLMTFTNILRLPPYTP